MKEREIRRLKKNKDGKILFTHYWIRPILTTSGKLPKMSRSDGYIVNSHSRIDLSPTPDESCGDYYEI